MRTRKPGCRQISGLLVLTHLLLAAGSACHSTGDSAVLTLGGERGTRQIRLPHAERKTDQALLGESHGVRIAVHYPARDPARARESAREAFLLMRQAADFVGDFFQVSGDFDLRAYLVPLKADEEFLRSYVRGWSINLLLPYHPGTSIQRGDRNAAVLCESVAHELTHIFLARHGVWFDDGWLGEGLPELVGDRFRRRHCQNLMPLTRPSQPPVVALRKIEIRPWKHYEVHPANLWGWLRERLHGDEDGADADRAPRFGGPGHVVWKYPAARALLERWLEAAAERGSEHPLRDLITAVLSHDRIGFEETREIARSMTGRSLEELGAISDQELAAALEAAWEERASPEPAHRLRALHTLRYLGLPPGADPRLLLEALDLPAGVEGTSQRGRRLLRAATGALAAAEDPRLAREAIERLEAGPVLLHRAVAPELWGVLDRAGQPGRAYETLKAATGDPWLTPEERWRAARVLEEIRESPGSASR